MIFIEIKHTKCIVSGVGNRLAHENPFILTMNIIFYRLHNYFTKDLCEPHKNWDDDRCFNEARKWVIATLQVIF